MANVPLFLKGPLVYVNYGQLDDFLYLTSSPDNHLYNLTGYICIVRYGRIYRGDKVCSPGMRTHTPLCVLQARLAQQFGCRGLLIYSDPQDYAPLGEPVYPHGAYLPEYGVQRGSLSMMEGDVLTPGIPAICKYVSKPLSKYQHKPLFGCVVFSWYVQTTLPGSCG